MCHKYYKKTEFDEERLKGNHALKILIINLMYIGDLLFITPAIHLLRTTYPASELDLLLDKKYIDIFVNNDHINNIIAIDKKGFHGKLMNYIRLIKDIKKKNYDLVINLHRNERSSAIAAFSNGKRIIGFASKGFEFFFSSPLKEHTDIHQVESYLNVLKVLEIKDLHNKGLEMIPGVDAENSADRKWTEAGLKSESNVIGLNTGGSWPTKRWTIEGFAQLINLLYKNNFIPVMFGGDMDKPMVEQIIFKTPKPPVIFTGKLNLLELGATIKKCSVFVSGDSGPMHIAASQQIPTVALFGPSDPIRYAPYHVDHILLRSLEETCIGCGLHKCEHHRCMKNIKAPDVYRAITTLLSKV